MPRCVRQRALDSLIEFWVRYFYDYPRERALTAAANLEPDPTARAAVRAAVNRHYLAVVRSLFDKGAAAGWLDDGADTEALLSLMLFLLPHLALAPHVQGLDPVLGMDGADADHAVAAAQRLLSTLLQPYRTNG
ncbi:hypothetical protein ACWGI9_10715 [Streptomyces sp. NPDC054833]